MTQVPSPLQGGQVDPDPEPSKVAQGAGAPVHADAPVPADAAVPSDAVSPIGAAVPSDAALPFDAGLPSGAPDPFTGTEAASADGSADSPPADLHEAGPETSQHAADPAGSVDPAGPAEPVGWASLIRQRLLAGWRIVTFRGRVALGLAVLAALLGAATGWREWTGIAAALVVLLLAAVLSALGRSSCTVTLELDRRRFVVGDAGTSVVRVSNAASRRMLPLRMELEVAGLPVTVRVPSLAAGGTHRMEIPLPTAHRAVITIGPLRAVRGDVFGLIRRVVHWPIAEQVYVHPRTVRPSGALPGFVRDLEGEESTRRAASDLSFHSLREYVPGDDRRFIHWKSTARNGTLQVREFRETHRSLVAVVVSANRGDYHEPGAVPAADSGAVSATVPSDLPDAAPASTERSARWLARWTRRLHDGLRDGENQDPGSAAGGSPDAAPADRLEGDEFELAVSCAASIVAELVRAGRDVVTDAAGTPIHAVSYQGVLDQFSGIGTAPAAPDLVFDARQAARRYPRMSLLVLVFGSTVGAGRVRAAMRACPPGVSVLAVRARVDDSPHPARLSGSDAVTAFTVLTIGELELLPMALRSTA